MSTTTSLTPPAFVVRELAEAWAATACHEMGHALATLAFDVPLDRVWVAYSHDPDLTPEWSIEGRTEFVPDGDGRAPVVDDNEAGPIILAGLEAEARWLCERGAGGLNRCRRLVWGNTTHHGPAGDVTMLEVHLSGADFSRHRIETRTYDLLDRHWGDVLAAAEVLAQAGQLSAAQVQGLFSEVGDWRLR